MEPTRREMVAAAGVLLLSGCARPPDWCEEPLQTEDGPPDSCTPTAPEIEGPFYEPSAPWRDDFTEFGDDGELVELSGVVSAGGCGTPAPGAVLEFWQADPNGRYDRHTDEMRYRGRVLCDDAGRWSLRTLLPGRYLNGRAFRPSHLHVKVVVDGIERLTTQLYFAEDPYLDCDPWVRTSLVLAVERDGGVRLGTFDFLLG